MTQRKVLAVVLISLGTVIFLGGVLYGSYRARLAEPSPARLPEKLAGLPLRQHAFGRDAVEQINQLHGLDFPLVSGAVGAYGDGRQAVLWVSGALNRWAAERMLETMTRKIEAGGSPFTTPEEISVDGYPVYRLEGMGQLHFYYVSGDLLIWLAADRPLAEQALSEVLDFYH